MLDTCVTNCYLVTWSIKIIKKNGSGVMSGPGSDLEFFFKNWTVKSQICAGKIDKVVIFTIQFLFNLPKYSTKKHSKLIILFTGRPTSVKICIEALNLVCIPNLFLQ